MLLSGARHADVAAAVGVSVRQVERWSALPEVREAAEAAEKSAPASAREVLDTAAKTAAENLVAMMGDAASMPADRLRATIAVLDRTGHGASSNVNASVKADVTTGQMPADDEAARRFCVTQLVDRGWELAVVELLRAAGSEIPRELRDRLNSIARGEAVPDGNGVVQVRGAFEREPTKGAA